MAWGAKTQIATALAVNNTVDDDAQFPLFAGSAVTLNPGEMAHVQILAAFPAAAVDDLAFRVVTTLDDATEVYDEIAFVSGAIGRVVSTTVERSITVFGCYKFRLEWRKLGTTVETVTVDAYVRKDGVSA